MANLRNEFEFRSALLTALGQEHTEAEAKNEDTWRRKMLDGLGVEYNQNDVNQFGLFREKLIEGVTNYSGGGGSSDFSTAEVTLINGGSAMGIGLYLCVVDDVNNCTATTARLIDGTSKTFNAILYNGEAYASLYDSTSVDSYDGNIETSGKNGYVITGDCTITIS